MFQKYGLLSAEKKGPPKGPREFAFYKIELDTGRVDAEAFKNDLRVKGVPSWGERLETQWTSAELESAALLWMTVARAPKGCGGPKYGTLFDMSRACPACGTGARQQSPLVVRESDLRTTGDVAVTLDSDLLCRGAVVEALRSENIAGLELRAVTNQRFQDLRWCQLLPTTVLKPFMETTTGLERSESCPVCNRDGWFMSKDEPLLFKYEMSPKELEVLPDVSWTFERFGCSVLRVPFQESHFAPGLFIVKPRVYTLMKKIGVPGLRFTPVLVEKMGIVGT